MLATVQALRVNGQSCEACADNAILFVFPVPPGADLRLGHVIDLDPLIFNRPQTARNLSTQQPFELVLKDNNVHDLRLPSGHGTNRLPSAERLGGA